MNTPQLLTCISVVLTLFGCTSADKPAADRTDTNTIEITPFIESSVILFDTTSIKTVVKEVGEGNLHEYESTHGQEFFLNEVQFNEFKKMALAMIRDPKAKLYLSANLLKPGDLIKKITLVSDSVETPRYDKDGNEFMIKMPGVVDSTWAIDQIRQIDFYETWLFDTKTNLIERRVLGYSIIRNDPEKNFNRELFSVFANDEAFLKFKKYKRW